MFKTIVAVLFALVLVIDFLGEMSSKDINIAELCVRGAMILACAYLLG